MDQCEGCFLALGCPRSCGGVVEAPAGWVSRVGLWGVGAGLGLLACKIGCPGGSGVRVLPARPCTPREGLLWGWKLRVGLGVGSSGFVVGLVYGVNFPEVKMWQAERAKKATCDRRPAVFCCTRKLSKQHGKQLLFHIEKEMQSATAMNACGAIGFRRGWLSSKSRRNWNSEEASGEKAVPLKRHPV